MEINEEELSAYIRKIVRQEILKYADLLFEEVDWLEGVVVQPVELRNVVSEAKYKYEKGLG